MFGLGRALIRPGNSERLSIADWVEMFSFNGETYPINFGAANVNSTTEEIENDFESYVREGYKRNGVVFSVVNARARIFSQIRFQYQPLNKGRPQMDNLFSTPNLGILETPWPNGNTAEALFHAIQDVDLAGNSYMLKENRSRLRRLRPDWVTILLSAPPDKAVQSDVVAYIYKPGNTLDPDLWEYYPVDGSNGMVAHWSPIPDPVAQYRGMSWLTPVLTDILADSAMDKHKAMFFKNGAPQPLDAKVLTPTGWSTMAAMRVGSQVIGGDGAPHSVLGVYPQGEQDIYRLTMTDGTSAESTLDHVWRVSNAYDRKRGVTRDMTLAEIVADGLRYPSGPHKWGIDNVEPIEYAVQANLPLDPYALGVLLGDGSFRGGTVALASHVDDWQELDAAFRGVLPEQINLFWRHRGNGSECRFSRAIDSPKENWLKGVIRGLGLDNKLSFEKFIPEMYMRASVKDRLSMLQGLIDSDGCIEETGVRFCSTSEDLARQVAELCMSIGGNATVSAVPTKGQWAVFVRRLPVWAVPCRLSRKVAAYDPVLRHGHRSIDSVEFSRRAPAQCIMVDSEDHMYVTDDMILTHNTPNLAVTLKQGTTEAQFKRFMEKVNESHQGVDKAYRTLYLGAGADVHVIGTNLQQMDFRASQGHGESRIASAGGIHPTIIGLAENIHGSELNAGNWQAAKDLLFESVLSWMWPSLCTAWNQLVPSEQGARLWYDTRDVPFLRQDRGQQADMQQKQAAVMSSLVMQGWEPDSIVKATLANDWSLLKHSGMISVQLFKPGDGPSSADQPESQQPTTPGGPANANAAKDAPAKAATAAKKAAPAKPATPAKGQ